MVQRRVSVASQVFRELYPFGLREDDPKSWAQHVRDNLAPEARAETIRFQGPERTAEMKLPGMNYNYAPHRRRLAQFQHHRELFKAMDTLGLTDGEVYELCSWDCSLYVKEKYVRDHPALQGLRDTTGEEVPTYEEYWYRRTQHEHASRVRAAASEHDNGTYVEGHGEDDQESDKEDLEMEEQGHVRAEERAIERQGPRVSARPAPISADARRMVSLSATSVRA